MARKFSRSLELGKSKSELTIDWCRSTFFLVVDGVVCPAFSFFLSWLQANKNTQAVKDPQASRFSFVTRK